MSLKSGTNDVNGSLYEFFRDDSLNATNYFATTKPIDTRHQFGGAVGFPLVRNKTFFFGDAETGRIRRETTTLSTLPSASARSGQFSRTIVDPLTRLPFPGNQIPATRMDARWCRLAGESAESCPGRIRSARSMHAASTDSSNPTVSRRR